MTVTIEGGRAYLGAGRHWQGLKISWRKSDVAERASETAEKASETAERASEAAERASEEKGTERKNKSKTPCCGTIGQRGHCLKTINIWKWLSTKTIIIWKWLSTRHLNATFLMSVVSEFLFCT